MVGKVQPLPGTPLQEHGGSEEVEGLAVELAQVHAFPGGGVDGFQGGGSVAGEERPGQVQPAVGAAQPKEFLHLGLGDAAATGEDQLLQQVFGVAEAAGGEAGDGAEGLRVGGDAFRIGDLVEPLEDDLAGEAAEVVPLAAGDDGGENLLGLGGAQDEDDVAWWLFQRLQEGVGGLVGEHVGFVDDVDLAGRLDRGEVDLVPDVADLVDAPVAGGVQLDDVEQASLVGCGAEVTGVAGIAVPGVETVDGLGHDPGGGGLAGAPGPAEEVGVAGPSLHDGVAEGGGDVLLPHQAAEAGGTPLAVVDLGGHGRTAWAGKTRSRA